jgi:FkbM family methyltransferase
MALRVKVSVEQRLREQIAMSERTAALTTPRKIAFVIAATDQGTLIVNRFDKHQTHSKMEYGVGYELLNNSAYEPAEINMVLTLLDARRRSYGAGVVALDCGANIGVHTIQWAKYMTDWGQVVAIEPQERIYYALAGNIAINNCFNARAIHAAVTSKPGTMKIPSLNYCIPTSFGSLELTQRSDCEPIGQPVDYSESSLVQVPTLSLDSLGLDRIDLIKIDVEGMEPDALEGACKTIKRDRPILVVEMIKNDRQQLRSWLESFGYLPLQDRSNLVAIHHSDKCLELLKSATSEE